MGYPKEKQNEYNKTYYTENKDSIAKKQSVKERCKFCGKCVRHDNIWKHTNSSYCVNRRKLSKKPAPTRKLTKKAIAAQKEKDGLKRIKALMINMERLYYENKLIEAATPPFKHF